MHYAFNQNSTFFKCTGAPSVRYAYMTCRHGVRKKKRLYHEEWLILSPSVHRYHSLQRFICYSKQLSFVLKWNKKKTHKHMWTTRYRLFLALPSAVYFTSQRHNAFIAKRHLQHDWMCWFGMLSDSLKNMHQLRPVKFKWILNSAVYLIFFSAFPGIALIRFILLLVFKTLPLFFVVVLCVCVQHLALFILDLHVV